MKTKVLTLEERGCGLGRKKRTKVHCLSANPSSPSLYLSKQLQDMDFVPVVVVMVVEELERLKILLVLTYSGTEGNSLTPHKVPGDTQCCPDTQLLVTVLQKQP